MNKYEGTLRFCGKEIPWHYITEDCSAIEYLPILKKTDGLLAIDIETTPKPQYRDYPNAGLSPYLSRVRLIQIYDGNSCYVFDLNEVDKGLFVDILNQKRFIAHNAIFELKFLMLLNPDYDIPKMNIGCTRILYKLLSHAIYPTDKGLSASLENITKAILKTELPKFMQLSDFGADDLTCEQIEYAALDAIACYMIAEKLSPGLAKFGLQNIYKITKEAQYPIAAMQLNGMCLDVPKHQAKIHVWRDELYSAKKKLMEFMGVKEVKDSVIRTWLMEHLDPETLALWSKTDSEQLSVSAHTFADFAYLPIVEPLAVYKKLEKLSSTYGDTLLNQINPSTHKLHADYNLCGARTGRLSSSHPNLQQFPRDKELRSHFVASEGNVFVCADFSQIEVRVAGEISGDEEMLSVYRQGLDIYSATAAKLTGKRIEDVGKKSVERRIAKALVLGLLFGLGAKKFSHYAKKGYNVDISFDESVENIKQFREIYSGHRAWQLAQSDECANSLIAVTVGGKRRCLDPDNYYGACLNHPVQGTAAEIILVALSNLYCYIRDIPEVRLVNCVHDEILLECHPDVAEQVQTLMIGCMTEAYLSSFPNGVTRGLVDSWIGTDWGAGKD